MAEVGYDLYIRMLDEAVKKLTGKDEGFNQDTVVDIKIDAYIPYDYIKDEVIKIQMYKKIAAIETKDDYMNVKESWRTDSQDIPDVVYNLMDIALLKATAKKAGVLSFEGETNGYPNNLHKQGSHYRMGISVY